MKKGASPTLALSVLPHIGLCARLAVNRTYGDDTMLHHAKGGRIAAFGEGDGTKVAEKGARVGRAQLPQMGVASNHRVKMAGWQFLLIIYMAMRE